MSRCFPYPPPGYEKSEALIESLKLQKEREKAKKERRKEEKKGKKEKSRSENGKTEKKKHSHKKRHYDELSQSNHKGAGDYVKTGEDETEQLEKSSLTEEQGPPAIQNSYDSSDSTQNSSKRKKCEVDDAIRNIHGNGLRIRFSLSKPKDREVHKDAEPPVSTEEPCFSGRIETTLAQEKSEPCFSGRTGAVIAQEESKIAPDKSTFFGGGGSSSSCDCSADKLFRKLIVNWNPPPLQIEIPDLDDQDWLFGARRSQHHEQGRKRGQVSGEEGGSSERTIVCSWPPRASHLPDVGIYALPYVVPF